MAKLLRTWSNLCETLSGTQIISSPYDNKTAPYLEEYRNKFDEYMFTIDEDAKIKYGSLLLVKETEDSNIYNSLIRACCIRNHYKWLKDWETMQLDYDPIANVDAHETVTTVYGEHVKDNAFGKRTETNTIGERSNSGTEDGNTFPFDNPDKQKHTAHNSFENTASGATDKKVNDNYTDTETSREHTDTVTTERHGNIGVTSTQQLIEAQRNIALFDFYAMVMADIVDACTIPVFQEQEVCYFGNPFIYK